MRSPTFVPDELWLARLWPKQMTSYQKGHKSLHRVLESGDGEVNHPTPYPSLDQITQDFPVMLYWARYYANMHVLPGVQSFKSIPGLLLALHRGDFDLHEMSKAMNHENERALNDVVPFWAGLVNRLVG